MEWMIIITDDFAISASSRSNVVFSARVEAVALVLSANERIWLMTFEMLSIRCS